MSFWAEKQVLVTGGLGFIGSTLAHLLVQADAKVLILDAKFEEYGSNLINIQDIKNEVTVIEADIRNHRKIENHIQSSYVVFHLAAQLSRVLSNKSPTIDASINCEGFLNILSIADRAEKPPRIVFTSSQAVVGKPLSLPFNEETPASPLDIYGANKRAGEMYCEVYNRSHGVPTTSARLTNVYGPRAQLSNPNYGVINKFIANSLRNEPLTVFEPGTMKRDFIYVNDVAKGLLHLGKSKRAIGERYVISSGQATTIKNLAKKIVDIAGSGKVEEVPWPDDWDSIKIGDLYGDPSKMNNHFGWSAKTPLKEGLKPTINYYQEHLSDYL